MLLPLLGRIARGCAELIDNLIGRLLGVRVYFNGEKALVLSAKYREKIVGLDFRKRSTVIEISAELPFLRTVLRLCGLGDNASFAECATQFFPHGNTF